MSELKRVGDIEVNQDLDFQRAEWRFQRVAWMVIALIAIASILGAFGRGPIANATATTAAGDLTVEYERIARHTAITRFDLHFARAQGEVGVSIPSSYLKGAELRSIVPEPTKTESGAGSSTFYFDLRPGAVVSFIFEPDALGSHRLDLGLNGRTALRLKQFVLP